MYWLERVEFLLLLCRMIKLSSHQSFLEMIEGLCHIVFDSMNMSTMHVIFLSPIGDYMSLLISVISSITW